MHKHRLDWESTRQSDGVSYINCNLGTFMIIQMVIWSWFAKQKQINGATGNERFIIPFFKFSLHFHFSLFHFLFLKQKLQNLNENKPVIIYWQWKGLCNA